MKKGATRQWFPMWFPMRFLHGKSRIKKKKRENDFSRHYRYISSAEFKIHINIIRLGVYFLTARIPGSSHGERAEHENRHHRYLRLLTVAVGTSYSSTRDGWRQERTGGAPSKSHLRAWLPVATRCFLPSLTICPRTTCVVYLQVASRTSAMRKTWRACDRSRTTRPRGSLS